MESSQWPENYPTPEAIVEASLSASNHDEEIKAFAAIGISEEEAGFYSHLVATASHGVWLFPEVKRIVPEDSHLVYRIALQRAQAGLERVLNNPNPTPSEREFIERTYRQRKDMEVIDRQSAFAVKIFFIVILICPLCAVICGLVSRLVFGQLKLD